MTTLEQVAEITGGGTPPRAEASYFGGGICWATPTDVTALQDLYIQDTKETLTPAGLAGSSARLLPAGAVLLTSRATIGFTAVSKVPISTNQGFVNFVCGPRIQPEYLAYWLRAKKPTLERLANGATFKEISRGTVRKLEINVPDRAEQARVVDLLSQAENIVRMRREAELKAKEIIPALFLDMFGDPARNEKRWERQHLGEIVKSIDSGKSPKCDDRARAPGEWGVLKLGAVTWGRYDESEYKVLPPNMKPYSASEVRAGDLLISRKNTSELVGASAYVWDTKGRMLLPDLIFRLNIADADIVDPIYLWALLSMDAKRNQLRGMASGAAASMPNISKGRLATLPIELPPIGAQRAFADRVRQARELEDQQGRAMAHAERAFQSLLAGVFGE